MDEKLTDDELNAVLNAEPVKKKGSIMCEMAYAQSKMLDHSSWNNLPRGITPSDIDCVFANGHQMLFTEISSTWKEWQNLKYGQRRVYEDLIVQLPNSLAALAFHNVPWKQQIDTKNDIISFAIMLNIDGLVCTSSHVVGSWPRFVEEFYAGKGIENARLIWQKLGN